MKNLYVKNYQKIKVLRTQMIKLYILVGQLLREINNTNEQSSKLIKRFKSSLKGYLSVMHAQSLRLRHHMCIHPKLQLSFQMVKRLSAIVDILFGHKKRTNLFYALLKHQLCGDGKNLSSKSYFGIIKKR